MLLSFERRDEFANATAYIGKTRTVCFRRRAAAGVPRYASGVAVRAGKALATVC